MGRKSAFTPEQWAIIERRHIVDGVTIYALAKEYGVNESSIRRKIGAKINAEESVKDELRDLAARKARLDADSEKIGREIEALPVVRQMIVNDLARKLNSVSNHVASSAEYMAATSHRLSGIANSLMDKVDDVEPEKSVEVLQKAAVLIRLSNDAAHIPLNLLKANQSTIDAMNEGAGDEGGRPAMPTYKVVHE